MIYFRLFIQAPAEIAWYIAKHRALFLSVSALLLISFASCLDSGYYAGKWLSIGAAVTLLAAARLYESYGAALAINFAYCTSSALWVACYNNRYAPVQPHDLQALRLFSMESAWKLALMTFPLLYLASARPQISLSRLRASGRFFAFIFFAISVGKTGYQWATDGCDFTNACGGALLNPSLNCAFLACLLPLLPYPLFCAALVAGCAFLGKTSIGAGMVALFVVGLGVKRGRWASALSAGGAIIALGVLTHHGKNFFDSSGRFQMWHFFMRLWAVNPKNWLFGTGLGTFGVFSINLQRAFNMNQGDWWIWPHNDWLEHLFTAGGVGALLLMWLYLWTALQLLLKGFYAELGALALFGVGMGCEYFPHIAPCCAFAVWLLAVGLLKVDSSESTPQNELNA